MTHTSEETNASPRQGSRAGMSYPPSRLFTSHMHHRQKSWGLHAREQTPDHCHCWLLPHTAAVYGSGPCCQGSCSYSRGFRPRVAHGKQFHFLKAKLIQDTRFLGFHESRGSEF